MIGIDKVLLRKYSKCLQFLYQPSNLEFSTECGRYKDGIENDFQRIH